MQPPFKELPRPQLIYTIRVRLFIVTGLLLLLNTGTCSIQNELQRLCLMLLEWQQIHFAYKKDGTANSLMFLYLYPSIPNRAIIKSIGKLFIGAMKNAKLSMFS